VCVFNLRIMFLHLVFSEGVISDNEWNELIFSLDDLEYNVYVTIDYNQYFINLTLFASIMRTN